MATGFSVPGESSVDSRSSGGRYQATWKADGQNCQSYLGGDVLECSARCFTDRSVKPVWEGNWLRLSQGGAGPVSGLSFSWQAVIIALLPSRSAANNPGPLSGKGSPDEKFCIGVSCNRAGRNLGWL